ncbi:MAG TPA: hypothetical protein DCP89_09330 [Acidimicrobiaceae bacterium]|jgi:hypothetical protein|nr:hypothetical protein [Acidimicrobiaceae bacterium]|tara:strand:- start:880 stop:1620 length:741 start_codon:yes stop_codon:yes gene_type:complete
MNGSEYLIVAVAVAVGAAVKGMTGLGLPLIAVPVITIFVGIEEAVLVMAFPTALSNAALVYEHRSAKKPENLLSFIIVGCGGAAAGAWALSKIDERWLLLILAVLLLCFLSRRFIGKKAIIWDSQTRKKLFVFVAAMCGFSQGAIGISGPVVAAWFQGYELDRQGFIFSTSSVFLPAAVTQIITITLTGNWTVSRLFGGALASIIVGILLPIGSYVGRRIKPAGFDYLITVLIALSTVILIARALG